VPEEDIAATHVENAVAVGGVAHFVTISFSISSWTFSRWTEVRAVGVRPWDRTIEATAGVYAVLLALMVGVAVGVLVGAAVGALVGVRVGAAVGALVGVRVVGTLVGAAVVGALVIARFVTVRAEAIDPTKTMNKTVRRHLVVSIAELLFSRSEDAGAGVS